jgi:type II secretory pathway pseudopilin PulG
MSIGNARSRQRGLTYLALLFFIAASGAMLAATGIIWSHERQRQKEQELLWIGNQFREAIGLYHQRTPGAIKRYPEKLEDLIEDQRYLTRQRYLRQIYRDPMTGKAQWGLVAAPGGGIMGVYSLSELAAVKSGNFADTDRSLSGAERYSAWRFVYVTPAAAVKANPN